MAGSAWIFASINLGSKGALVRSEKQDQTGYSLSGFFYKGRPTTDHGREQPRASPTRARTPAPVEVGRDGGKEGLDMLSPDD